jgi:uncharacterized membrane protein
VIYAVSAFRRRFRDLRGGGNDAKRILDERYARGEISRHEYQQMRKDLEG